MKPGKKAQDLLTRFNKYVYPEPNTGCWLWGAYCTWEGYGTLSNPGMTLAHRISYTLFKGPIPDGLTIDHLCRNPSCVNPDHLEAVTTQVNSARAGTNIGCLNAVKTECPKGHEYSEENTYRWSDGRRECLTCKHDRARRYYKRIRAAKLA